MRIFVVLACSLALATVALGAKKEEKKSQPKKQAQTAQHATHATGNRAGGGGAGNKRTPASTGQQARTLPHRIKARRPRKANPQTRHIMGGTRMSVRTQTRLTNIRRRRITNPQIKYAQARQQSVMAR